jgi:uncharacterized protein YlzI (FlbEa/FlbD family)
MAPNKLITVKDLNGEIHWLNADQIVTLTARPEDGLTQIQFLDGSTIVTTKRASTINQELRDAPSQD